MIARGPGLGVCALLIGLSAPRSAAAVCSVFDAGPCTPTVCSVFDPAPCIPDVRYPVEDLRWTVNAMDAQAGTQAGARLAQGRTSQCPPKDPPPRKLNTIEDVFTAFCACWKPPPERQARAGMEITVRFSFNRGGEILGEPRFTFVTADVSNEVKAIYKRAVADTLTRCTPLPFTPELGGALAGRPFSLRFIDDRGIRKVEHHGRQ